MYMYIHLLFSNDYFVVLLIIVLYLWLFSLTAAIPGFLYDEVKRRYFRIPASHFSSLPQYQHVLSGSTPTPSTSLTKCTSNSPAVSSYSIFCTSKHRKHDASLQDSSYRCIYFAICIIIALCLSCRTRGYLYAVASSLSSKAIHSFFPTKSYLYWEIETTV